MPIVCPQCATSYAVDPATLGDGRHVRCARCKQVWLAQPQPSLLALVSSAHDATEAETQTELHSIALSRQIDGEPPEIESPPLAIDWSSAERRGLVPANDAGPGALIEAETNVSPFPAVARRANAPRRSHSVLPTAAAALCALVAALVIWRGEMVRLMPQTAGFYRIIGLDVNQRGLTFRDVKLSTDTVEGKPVLVVEGIVESRRRNSVTVPPLHFMVRDARGTVIYGWNAKLEQSSLKPGETAPFRSRLASPPAEAHSVDLRFLHKRDLATGAA